MSWTTGKTTAQTAAVLVTAGALADQALGALHSGGWTKNVPQELWGVLVQCTSGWNAGDPVWEYDTAPTYAHTGQTFAQTLAALVTAGALTDQAQHVLGGLAWVPGVPGVHWNVLVKCTSGWNATTGPVFSYFASPS